MKFSNLLQPVYLLVIVILLGAILRLNILDKIPPGLTNDEANIGYDAYSILKTGRDQWGTLFPLSGFKGFGDYRLPLFTYIVVPFVASLGLTEQAVRLPAALFGILTIVIFFMLAQQLFHSKWAGFVAGLMLALNPWHIGMSRVGIEATTNLFLITCGFYCLLKAAHKKYVFLYVSLFFFALSIYTYTASIVFVPLVVLLFIVFRGQIVLDKKTLVSLILFSLILFLPYLLSANKNAAAVRFGQTNFGHDIGLLNEVNEKRGECQKDFPNFFCRSVYNKGAAYTKRLFNNYISHFSPEILLINGTPTQFSILPQQGLFYYYEFALFSAGLFFSLFTMRKYSFLIGWFLISPISDSITGGGHYSRFFFVLIPFLLIGTYGVVRLLSSTKSKYILTVVVVLLVVETITFLTTYYSYFPRYYSRFSHYGYKELFHYLEDVKQNYDSILLSSRVNDTKQYIFYLFFSRYDPEDYQLQALTDSHTEGGGWIRVDSINNYFFVNELPSRSIPPNALLVGSPDEFPAHTKTLHTINDLKGDALFTLVESQFATEAAIKYNENVRE